jgi:hypothetical protein
MFLHLFSCFTSFCAAFAHGFVLCLRYDNMTFPTGIQQRKDNVCRKIYAKDKVFPCNCFAAWMLCRNR